MDGEPELTPVAIKNGRLLAQKIHDELTGQPVQIFDTDFYNEFVPTTIFTDPEYGTVGYSEEDAVQKYSKDLVVCYHRASQKLESSIGFENEPQNNYMKVVCLKSSRASPSGEDKVIGMHYLGHNAGEIIQGYTLGLTLGMRKRDLDRMVGIHPTVSEEFNNVQKNSKDNNLDIGSC